ncbi:MAG: ribonuclease H-like domain-containing protein [Capnocytophaga sp.]|nr:ribonuclease H-like domain-containing protein [Capnocytophaga sp.]
MDLASIKLSNVLFLDIETVPLYPDFENVPEEERFLWEEKTRNQRGEKPAEEFYERAGIWAEFGKIVCISVGYFLVKDAGRQFRVRSFTGEEKKILEDFSYLVGHHFHKKHHLLAAHNGKEFDFPFIARRMIINELPLPNILNLYGKKPWEFQYLDTLDLWKFGDYKNYTSLRLLAYILKIPSPKEDINGSEVRSVFYEEKNIQRIADYCQKDTITVAQIILKLRNEPLLSEKEIHYVS